MITKTITYTDYNGVVRTEDFYFNLNKIELIRFNLKYGGLEEWFKKATEKGDETAVFNLFVDLVQQSYGVKSEDGRHFRKSQDLVTEFMDTEAYSELIMSLFSGDGSAALEFVRGIIPPADAVSPAAR